MLGGIGAGFAHPARAATVPVSVSITSAPNPVAPGSALAYAITIANTGGAAASGLSLSDIVPLALGNGATSLFYNTNLGSCSDTTASSTTRQVTCTAASLPAGAVWSVSINGLNTATAGSAPLADTATVTGSESGVPFSQSASTQTPVDGTTLAGLAQTTLLSGLKNPTLIRFAPDGDAYIGEQGGTILIYRQGKLLATPVISIPNVQGTIECGLLGLAFDPNFSTTTPGNGYIYVSYRINVTNSQNVTQPFAQLSRFTVVNDVANPSSEKVFYRGNQAQNGHHPGNDLKLGPDGKLWWSVGDNDPNITNAQALGNIYGKILRFNLDGSVPSDNPFLNVAGAVPYIYADGVRNPFRFTFLPNGEPMMENTGSTYINDAWEDLYLIQPGENFGWPYYSGYCGSCGYANPTFEYGHEPWDGAASAIAAYSAPSAGPGFPQPLATNVVYVGDYDRGDIEAVQFDPTYHTPMSDTIVDTGAGSIADLEEGPDGNLYFVSIFQGTMSEISAPGPFPPIAAGTATPETANPLNVDFSSAGSSDPYGAPLSFSWNFGDGSPASTAADPTHMYTLPGSYTATLTVSDPTHSSSTNIAVIAGTPPPMVTINAPSTYNAGQTINFSGTAVDSVDGVMPGYDYTWKVDFISNGVVEPSWYGEVAYPFYGPMTGSTSGSVTIPVDPYQTPNTYYRISLTATDSLGLSTTATQNVTPNLTTLSVSANVAGAGFYVDGLWQTQPYSASDVVGAQHALLGMPSAQVISATRYRFGGWADGSALTDTVTTPSGGGSYTADYDPVTAGVPSPWQSTDVGAPVTPGGADYSSASQSFYLDGAGTDVYPPNVQFHYVYQTLTGDGTIVARVRYQSNSSPWAKAGVMVMQSPPSSTAPFVDAFVTPDVSPATPNINGVGCVPGDGCMAPLPAITPAMGNGARMQTSSTYSATPASYPANFSAPNKWVKLVKSGSTFTSFISSDGVNWTQMGAATVSMTGPVTFGLFDTGHDSGQLSTVAFDNVQVTPANTGPPPPGVPPPWADTDVGNPALAGSASYANGVFTLNGGGADIWGSSDQFNYVYQPDSGNATLIARITSQSNTSSNAKAGIMFKQSTTAGSDYMLIAEGPGYTKVQWDFNGSSQTTTLTMPNAWMKLVRVGSAVTAYISSDGVNWTTVLHKTLPLTGSATAGLYVCSHNAKALGTATFDNVSFTSP